LALLDNVEGGDLGQTNGSEGKSEEPVPIDKTNETRVGETGPGEGYGTLGNNLSTGEPLPVKETDLVIEF
jgi:hypothetical protein